MSDRSTTISSPFPQIASTGPATIRRGSTRTTRRSAKSTLLAAILGLISAMPAASQQVCKPTLAVTDIRFSEWRLPTMERKWTATVSVDASRCAANSSGYFEIGFLRLIENGVDTEFSEEFAWVSPSVNVGLDFWANEAVGLHWINKVSACPCAGQSTASAGR